MTMQAFNGASGEALYTMSPGVFASERPKGWKQQTLVLRAAYHAMTGYSGEVALVLLYIRGLS